MIFKIKKNEPTMKGKNILILKLNLFTKLIYEFIGN